MIPKYDIAKLERAIYDFNKATGVSITLFDHERNPVTTTGTGCSVYCSYIAGIKEMKHLCSRSNNDLIDKCKKTKSLSTHICRAGLLDIAIPLIHFDEIVGFLMIGQIKQRKFIPENLLKFTENAPELEKRYESLPLLDEEKINSIINIGSMLTKYIMLENMVQTNPSKGLALINNYIEEHLTERITVSEIAEKTHMSSSGIYKCLRKEYGCTLGEFILSKRMEKGVSLLERSELSISEIAEATGFSDTARFSKSFKKAKGISPLKYRKKLQNSNL